MPRFQTTVPQPGNMVLPKKMIRDWRKSKDRLKEMPKSKYANRGLSCKWPILEEALFTWVEEKRKSGYIVTRNAIRLQVRMAAIDRRIQDFRGTASWCSKFIKRKKLVLRQRTKIAQKLPDDLDDKIVNFHSHAIKMRKLHDYPLHLIGNMDETPMQFDMPGNRTVNARGEKTVFVKTTGHEKTHFTLVLCCMADGTKLKPMVIFKRKTMPKEKFLSGVLVHVHEKWWMDEAGTKKWLDEVWGRRNGGLRNEKSMLVWDCFSVHLVDSVKHRTKAHNTDMVVIPGCLTSVLQPLDVSLNKPMKSKIRDSYNDWMMNGEKTYTKGGNMRAATLPTLCE